MRELLRNSWQSSGLNSCVRSNWITTSGLDVLPRDDGLRDSSSTELSPLLGRGQNLLKNVSEFTNSGVGSITSKTITLLKTKVTVFKLGIMPSSRRRVKFLDELCEYRNLGGGLIPYLLKTIQLEKVTTDWRFVWA